MLRRSLFSACCGFGVAAMPILMVGCSPSEPAKNAPEAVEVEEVAVPAEPEKSGEASVAESAKEAVDAAKNEADRVIDEAKEAVETTVDAATEKAAELKDKAAEAASAAADQAAEAASEAANAVKDAADAVSDAAAEAADKVKDAAEGEESVPAAEPAADESAANAAADESVAAVQEAVLTGSAMSPQAVQLGDASLTSGVPGAGPITLEQIDAWLSDPQNHVELMPELPLGLATGATQITDIDVNPLTRAKIELGRQLYFDTRLSKNSTISCASCHNPIEGYTAHT